MGQGEGIDILSACPLTPSLKTRLSTNTTPREIIVAASLAFILAAAGLGYCLMAPPPPGDGRNGVEIPYAVIAIDGDANFSDTALLEGWPGDGSPENPYMIEGLDINLGDAVGHGIGISNTQVSFTIGNCNITGAYARGPCGCGICHGTGAGIYLVNVTNGELVNNTCNNNGHGIYLWDSHSNTVVNNTCNNNTHYGISLEESNSNTVVNNTCNNNNECNGISLGNSDSNTVTDNTCSNNTRHGIGLYGSDYNTVANNTCNSNGLGVYLHESYSNYRIGIYLHESYSNTVANNTCNGNGDTGIYLWDSHLYTMANLNTVANNTCNNNRIGIGLYNVIFVSEYVYKNICSDNTEHDIYIHYSDTISEPADIITDPADTITDLTLIGLLVGITLLGAGWRMTRLSRVVSTRG